MEGPASQFRQAGKQESRGQEKSGGWSPRGDRWDQSIQHQRVHDCREEDKVPSGEGGGLRLLSV